MLDDSRIADIIDIGGCSTRPYGDLVLEEEEMARVIPALSVVRKHFPHTIISLDTFRASVAQRAITEAQVDIINDVSAGNWDKGLLEVVINHKIPYILSFMPNHIDNRDNLCVSENENIMAIMIAFFAEKLDYLHSHGVADVIIDPAFGFGKTIDQNYAILRRLSELSCLNSPILAGLSRKSMIYKALDITSAEALNGTTVLNTVALLHNADILRVHDVREARQTIDLLSRLTLA